MKRRRYSSDEEEEEGGPDVDRGSRPVPTAAELRQRLQQATAPSHAPMFGLRAGEALIEIEDPVDRATLTNKKRAWTREDGSIVKTGKHGEIQRLHPEEEDFGVSWRENDFERQDIVNRDPRVAWLRLLAGWTHEEVEDMFDEADVRNQRTYAEEIKAWNKMERERIMVGSSDKKEQLDMVQAKRESIVTEMDTLHWAQRFFEQYAEEMTFLVNPLAKSTDEVASLTVCQVLCKQQEYVRDMVQILTSAKNASLANVDITPMVRTFADLFPSAQKDILFTHELADIFLTRARSIYVTFLAVAPPIADFERFVLFLYKYVFTRDEYAPGILEIKRSVINPAQSNAVISYVPLPTTTRKTSTQEVFYESAKLLFFTHIRGRALQALSTTIYRTDTGELQPPSDDATFFEELKRLTAQLSGIQDQLKDRDWSKEGQKALEAKKIRLEEQIQALKSEKSQVQSALLRSLRTPLTAISFDAFLDAKDAGAVADNRVLRALREKHAATLTWLRTSNAIGRAREASLDRFWTRPPAPPQSSLESLGISSPAPSPLFIGSKLVNMAFALLISSIDSITNATPAFTTELSKMTADAKKLMITLFAFDSRNTIQFNGDKIKIVTTGLQSDTYRVKDITQYANFQALKSAHGEITIKITLKRTVDSNQFLTDCFNAINQNRGDKDGLDAARKIIAATHGEYTELAVFRSVGELDFYNLVILDVGYTLEWQLPKNTPLIYFEPSSQSNAITQHASMRDFINNVSDALLAGSLGALALFMRNEKIVSIFDTAVLTNPLLEYFRLMDVSTPNSKNNIVDILAETRGLLKSLDAAIGTADIDLRRVSNNNLKKAVEAFKRQFTNDPLVSKYITGWHESLLIVVFILAWRTIVFPLLEKPLQDELDKVDKVITDVQAELYRLATGTSASIKTQRDKVKELYVPTARWQTRPEFTGRITLAPRVVAAIDHAMTLIRQYAPSLRGAPLDALMMSNMDSGLPGAFAQLVASLMNKTQLTFPHSYNKDYQYLLDPKFRQDAMQALQGYTVRQLPNATWEARPPGGGGASWTPSSSSVSVHFI